jgi:hypothetical protein
MDASKRGVSRSRELPNMEPDARKLAARAGGYDDPLEVTTVDISSSDEESEEDQSDEPVDGAARGRRGTVRIAHRAEAPSVSRIEQLLSDAAERRPDLPATVVPRAADESEAMAPEEAPKAPPAETEQPEPCIFDRE